MADLDDYTRTFRAKVRVCPCCDCWVWTSQLDDGYARFKLRGRPTYAHRYAFERKHGIDLNVEFGDDTTVDHLCDRTRRCVNPDHLEPVSRAENARRANERRWHGVRSPICSTCDDCPLKSL